KIGHAGVNLPAPADGNGPSDGTSPGTDLIARPPTRGGQGLPLEEAKSLALRLNPLLGQSLAAVETAAGNEEIAFSGFLPAVQGNYGYQGFSSQTGFAG